MKLIELKKKPMKFLPIIIMNKTGNPIILTQADLELLPKLSEMVFAEDAWALFSKIISKNDNFLTDLLKANASNITLYYFQKAMKYQNVAQDFLDQTCPTHLTIDDLNNPYAKAIYSEALDRKIKVKALKTQKTWKGLRRGRYYFLLLYHYFSTLWTFRVSLLEWENQIGNYLTSALDDWRRKNLKKAIRIY